jgi:hypothetical protein
MGRKDSYSYERSVASYPDRFDPRIAWNCCMIPFMWHASARAMQTIYELLSTGVVKSRTVEPQVPHLDVDVRYDKSETSGIRMPQNIFLLWAMPTWLKAAWDAQQLAMNDKLQSVVMRTGGFSLHSRWSHVISQAPTTTTVVTAGHAQVGARIIDGAAIIRKGLRCCVDWVSQNLKLGPSWADLWADRKLQLLILHSYAIEWLRCGPWEDCNQAYNILWPEIASTSLQLIDSSMVL